MKNSGFEIRVSPRAQQEIEAAISFYESRSEQAPDRFVHCVADCYKKLALNPNFEIRYKNVRCVKVNMFPYSLYFVILEKDKRVEILSCFPNRSDPNFRP